MIIYTDYRGIAGFTGEWPFPAPRQDQNQGDPRARMAEAAGRVCYDSYGKGRSSEEFHKHIRDVGHLSVYAHVGIVVEMPWWVAPWLVRPGVTFVKRDKCAVARVNYRAILEWERWDLILEERYKTPAPFLGLWDLARAESPMVFPERAVKNEESQEAGVVTPQVLRADWGSGHADLDTCTVYFKGSRGFSHEQVRHGYNVGISQRSTRYVDEGEGTWVRHPLLVAWAKESGTDGGFGEAAEVCKATYKRVAERMEVWLLGKGVGASTARKQARGAARGVLGNALETQLVFTTSVRHWKMIFAQRMSEHADAEIREMYEAMFQEFGF